MGGPIGLYNTGKIKLRLSPDRPQRIYRVSLSLKPRVAVQEKITLPILSLSIRYADAVILQSHQTIAAMSSLLARRSFDTLDEIRAAAEATGQLQGHSLGRLLAFCPSGFFVESIGEAKAGVVAANVVQAGEFKSAEFSFRRVSWLGRAFLRLRALFASAA